MVEETSYQMLEFYHFATWRGLNLLSSITSTMPTFLVKKKKQSGEASRGVYIFFEKTRKNFKSNLVLVVVLVLESKRLYRLPRI